MANFNFNKVILGGRLTSDPELKQNPNGIPVLSFSIAVNRRFTKNAEGQTTDFIRCVAWRSNAEFIARYFHKGSCICVVGSIQMRTWKDAKDQKQYSTEIVVEEASFVDSKGEGSSGAQSAEQTGNDYNPYTPPEGSPAFASPEADKEPSFKELENEDDLPF